MISKQLVESQIVKLVMLYDKEYSRMRSAYNSLVLVSKSIDFIGMDKEFEYFIDEGYANYIYKLKNKEDFDMMLNTVKSNFKRFDTLIDCNVTVLETDKTGQHDNSEHKSSELNFPAHEYIKKDYEKYKKDYQELLSNVLNYKHPTDGLRIKYYNIDGREFIQEQIGSRYEKHTDEDKYISHYLSNKIPFITDKTSTDSEMNIRRVRQLRDKYYQEYLEYELKNNEDKYPNLEDKTLYKKNIIMIERENDYKKSLKILGDNYYNTFSQVNNIFYSKGLNNILDNNKGLQ